MGKGFTAVRDEMGIGFVAVRDEMHKDSRALRAEISDLRVEVAKVPLETVKWLLAVLDIPAAVRHFFFADQPPRLTIPSTIGLQSDRLLASPRAAPPAARATTHEPSMS